VPGCSRRLQVLGDRHGNVVPRGERECSIRRPNRKVVEEAPSPLLEARSREMMSEEAVRLTCAIGYGSARTVEVAVGQDRSFYFLEMNTRSRTKIR
jgi:propionyl-CoA carboxylase alpha chain